MRHRVFEQMTQELKKVASLSVTISASHHIEEAWKQRLELSYQNRSRLRFQTLI